MRHLAFGALIGAGLLVVSCEKKAESASGGAATTEAPAADQGHVLAKKNSLPVGKIQTKEAVSEMKDAVLNFEGAGQEMEGKMSRHETKVETLEPLSATKARQTVVSVKNESSMVMNGQSQPTPEEKDPLTGIPVIIENKDGVWTATLESGTATPEQEAALEKIAKKPIGQDDLAMYGEAPRKPGDKWDVDPQALEAFGDAESLTGSFTVEFVEVKDYQGTPCAILKSVFDVSGSASSEEGAPPMTIKLKGTAVVHRSLADLVDLDAEVKGQILMEGEPAPGMSMKVEGPMIMSSKTTLK